MSYYTCPICGSELGITEYRDDYYVVEEYHKCYQCNYYYEYAYGHYQMRFGNDEFCWSYHTTGNERAILFTKLKRREFMARRNWHKGIRRKYKVEVE